MKTCLVLFALALLGCAGAPLTAEEQAVRVYRKSDPDVSCKQLSKVLSPGMGSFSEQGREDKLKRKARAAGGNAVVVDRTDEFNNVYGTAFVCP